MTTHHVTPTGKLNNDGSESSPWSLEHALAPNNEKLQPGDEVRLHSGRYPGKWTSRRNGEKGAPIVYRPAGDGRVILDGTGKKIGAQNWDTLVLGGRHVWFQGVEITNSDPTRLTDQAGSSPESLVHRGGSVSTHGHFDPNAGEGCKVINCIIYDTNGGPGQWQHSNDAEIYGCIIFNNGWHSKADGGHGHGLYFQNNGAPGKLVAENILFGNGGDAYGLHFYGSGNANLKFGRFIGNVSLQNNLLGGNAPLSNLHFEDNFTFGGWTRIGWDSGAANVRNVGSKVIGNYLVGGYRGLSVFKHSNAVVRGNTVINGFEVSNPADNDVGNNVTEKQAGIQIYVRPNRYDSNRWHVIVFNWEAKGAIQIQAPFDSGDEWVLTDAFNPLAPPVKTGKGPMIELWMNGLVAAQPLSNPWQVAHPGPVFGTFILQRVGDGTDIPPVEPPDEPPPPPPPPPPLPGGDRADLVEARRLLDKYILRTKP